RDGGTLWLLVGPFPTRLRFKTVVQGRNPMSSLLRADVSARSNNKPGLRILLVEDGPDCALSLAMLLRMEGHEGQVAFDGSAALRAAHTFAPQVVFLDIGLPDMDGYEVARRLGERTAGKPPLIIAISGFGRDEDRRRSEEAGVNLHLVKPTDPERL